MEPALPGQELIAVLGLIKCWGLGKHVQMMPAPDGYRVAVFSDVQDADTGKSRTGTPGRSAGAGGVRARAGVSPLDGEPGERRVTFAFVRSSHWNGVLGQITDLVIDAHPFVIQLLAPDDEPNQEYGAEELQAVAEEARARDVRNRRPRPAKS